MKTKKIIIAPDSFKGTLRSTEVCRIWKEAFDLAWPQAEVVCLPMADGGEGSLDAVVAATGAKLMEKVVSDPLGRPVAARWALIGNDSAFIEAAEANGIERIISAERNPMKTTTYGVGEMIMDALANGVRNITMAIGGSATVDGGIGMLSAMGYRFLDGNGNEVVLSGGGLSDIVSVIVPELPQFSLKIACDVTNPLLGENGSARIFGPQKGATPEMVEELESGMASYSQVMMMSGLADSCDQPGDGAAGGLGFALRGVLGGKMESGARLIAEIAGLERHLEGASLLITGEGCSDSQTLFGKLPVVLAEIAASRNVPSILCSGAVNDRDNTLFKCFCGVFSTVGKVDTLQNVLDSAGDNLARTARSVAAALHTAHGED